MVKNDIKYKYLTEDELKINTDRLSRFKLPEDAYERVFFSVISRCLISPKISKAEYEKLDPVFIAKTVAKIWNASVENLFGKDCSERGGFKILKYTIGRTFSDIPERTKIFMNEPLILSAVISKFDDAHIPLNVKYLKICEKIFKDGKFDYDDLKTVSEKYSLRFPAQKLIIAEGITEETLLPVFAKKLDYDFDKNGVFIVGAGGKSKSPSLYAKLKNKLKIPVILLFDADAEETVKLIEPCLLKKDKTVILTKGEFEDILSHNLIKRTLNKVYEPISPVTAEELRIYPSMCRNIENFYRTRHLGEFKKSVFSKLIAENICYPGDITKDVTELFNLFV